MQHTKEHYRLLFDQNPLPMWVYDTTTLRFLTVNEAAIRHYGYSREEFLSMTLSDIRPPEDVDKFLKSVSRVSRGMSSSGRWRHRKKDGGLIWVEITSDDIEFMDHQARLVLVRDITEQLAAQELLEHQKRFTGMLIENLTIATFVADAEHRVVLWNKACEALTGRTASEMLGTSDHWKAFYSCRRPTLCDVVIDGNFEDLPTMYEKHSRSPLISNGLQAEGWYSGMNGRDRYLVFDAAPIFDTGGNLTYAIETLRDMTAQKLSEKALAAHLDLLRVLMDTIPTPIFYKDRQGRYLGCNRAFESYLGKTQDELLGKTVYDIAPQHLADVYHAADEELFLAPGVQTYEASVKYADGTLHDVIFYKATFSTVEGETSGLVGTMVDITDRKGLESALRESEQRLQAIFQTGPYCVKLVARDGTLIEMNPAGLAMIEADSLEEARGKSLLPLIAPSDRPAFTQHMEEIFRGKQATLDFELTGLRGTRRWLSTHSVPFRDPDGRIIALLGITRDITEQRMLEEQLRHAQKLEGIGQLAGGIAHDFNNILSAVIGFGSVAQMNINDVPKLAMYLNEIVEAGQKGASLTHQLLAFSRKQVLDMKTVDLNDIAANLMKLLRRLIREDIILSFMPARSGLTITADSSQIDQVLINLVTNARDSIADGGEIVISTDRARMDENFIHTHGFGEPGEYAMLIVADTGTGMPKEIRDKIFEPFFTTKEPGKGTGLGLAMAYGIVKQHNGYIDVYSEPGRGTTFKVYLPLSILEAEKSGGAGTSAPRGRGETILVAEDDEALRKLVSAVLKQYGYSVIEAKNGEEAVTRFSDAAAFVDLVILDAIMPKKNGKEASESMRQIRPDIRIIIISGYTAEIFEGGFGEGVHFVHKPVSPPDLAKKIRAVLDS